MSDLLERFNPKRVAVLGASDNPLKAGGRPIQYMLLHGFAGTIYPINPNRPTIQGLTAYASLEALPHCPDAVIICVAAADVPDAVDTCIRMGVKLGVIYSSGFAETGESGRIVQSEMAQRARAGGMRLLGPNTQGIANFSSNAILHFAASISEVGAQDGPIAVVSQSGAGSQIIYGGLRRKGLGARYMVATGNEADIDVSEVVLAVAQDPDIRVILLYAESIRNPALLARAAALAHQRDVPILVVKAGSTPSGQATAASHTGAMANEDVLMDTFLRQHGLLRLADFHALFEYAPMFLQRQRPRGRRVVAISNSGATCVLAADAAAGLGLDMAPFGNNALGALRQVLPAFVTARNPIDTTTALMGQPDMFERTLAALAEHQCPDLLHIGFPVGSEGYDYGLYAKQAREFSDTHGVAVAASINQDWMAKLFQDQGLPAFRSEADAMRALALLASYTAQHEQVHARMQVLHDANTSPGSVADHIQGDAIAASHACTSVSPSAYGHGDESLAEPLDEAASMVLLAQAGLPVVAHHVCTTLQGAQQALHTLGAPVVLKGVAATLTHKSEHGLVRLGLTDASALEQAYAGVTAACHAMGERQANVLVARQVRGDFELALGAHIDALLGPVVMVAHGGVLIEALEDRQFLLAPFSADEARSAIGRLHVARLFGAQRGMPAVDIDALVQAMLKVSALITRADTPVVSLDMNPVIVGRGDRAPVIVDAVAVCRQSP